AQLEQVERGLAEHAAHGEQQAVIVVARIIDAVTIGEEGAHERSEGEQAIPLGVVAGDAAGLVGEDEADLPERDGADQGLQAFPRAVLAGLAQVVVKDLDPLGGPAQGPGPLDQRVLVLLTGAVLAYLSGRRLADVDVGAAFAVAWSNLVVAQVSGSGSEQGHR